MFRYTFYFKFLELGFNLFWSLSLIGSAFNSVAGTCLRWPGRDIFYPRLFFSSATSFFVIRDFFFFIRDFFLFATSFFRDFFFVQTQAHVMSSAISSDSYKRMVIGLHRLLTYVFVCVLCHILSTDFVACKFVAGIA